MDLLDYRETAKSQQPLISIVINNFNYAQYLPAAIESALAQSYGNIEVVVVDDGSTDDSRQCLRKFAGRKVRVIEKSNGGQASALNTGFEVSSGEIVIFLDSDDILFPSCAQRVANAWQEGLSKLHYKLDFIDVSGSKTGRTEPPLRDLPCGNLAPQVAARGGYLTPPASGNAYSRKYLNQVMPIPPAEWRGFADCYLVNLAPFYGEIGAINETLAGYRVHSDSMSAVVAGSRIRLTALHKHIVAEEKVRRLLRPLRERELGAKLADGETSYHKLRSRLISKKLSSAAHPIPSDNLQELAISSVRQMWRAGGVSTVRRLLFTCWILAMFVLPKAAAESVFVSVFRYRARA